MSNLTEKDYEEILRRKFRTNDIKLVRYTVKPITEGQGFLGDHFKLEIQYELNNQPGVDYFFVKTKPTNFQAMIDQAKEGDVFTLEIFIYDVLFLEFEKYGIDISFAPKCYFCVPSETLVLDDMIKKGFTVPDSQKFFDVQECKAGLNTIAAFHASGFLYEQAKSKELGRNYSLEEEYPEMFEEKLCTFFCKKRNPLGEKWFTMGRDIFYELIKYLPEPEEYRKEFQEKVLSYPLGKILVEETNLKKCIGHADTWCNNFLFKYENNLAKSSVLFDYQTVRYSYPSLDCLSFLISTTDMEFFHKYSKELLQYYYDTLKEKVLPYNIEDFCAEEDFKKSLDLVKFEAQIFGFFVHAYFFIPEKFTQSYISPGVNSEEYKFNHIVQISSDCFHKDEKYRNIILKDLYELRATLFKQQTF